MTDDTPPRPPARDRWCGDMIELHGLRCPAAAVLRYLAEAADNTNLECWPALTTIARRAGVGKNGVTEGVNVLVDLGVVRKRKRQRATSIYRLILESRREGFETPSNPAETPSNPASNPDCGSVTPHTEPLTKETPQHQDGGGGVLLERDDWGGEVARFFADHHINPSLYPGFGDWALTVKIQRRATLEKTWPTWREPPTIAHQVGLTESTAKRRAREFIDRRRAREEQPPEQPPELRAINDWIRANTTRFKEPADSHAFGARCFENRITDPDALSAALTRFYERENAA